MVKLKSLKSISDPQQPTRLSIYNSKAYEQQMLNLIRADQIFTLVLGVELGIAQRQFPRYIFRVVSIDDKDIPVTKDYYNNRINVHIVTQNGVQIIQVIDHIG
jgi:hypothetical protein